MSDPCKTVMITAKRHLEILIGGEDDGTQTLVDSWKRSEGGLLMALAKGRQLMMINGFGTNGEVSHRIDVQFPIVKIFFHSFESKNRVKSSEKRVLKDYLVVCGEHRLVFIAVEDFHLYHYEVPFQVREVHPTNFGLLIERFYDTESDVKCRHTDAFHLYSLSFLFGELLPVIYKSSGGISAQWKFCWQALQDDAIVVGAEKNHVLTFDVLSGVHRIYKIRETEEEEVRAAIRLIEGARQRHHDVTDATMPTPRQLLEATEFSALRNHRSPAVLALAEAVDADMENRSPESFNASSFGHSTPLASSVFDTSFPGGQPLSLMRNLVY
ncbi:unnamed protein product [Caenorhabditis auriculariae]|uniref:Uncharacterized protein n=1 Tax=Caenorhabditis auriculariae TaxID=2777116 RepID=A0A8S1HBH2_9PELO|nr:unnamed protein product [Caenorhabditis auriculariae]